jgi:hypothetical protein
MGCVASSSSSSAASIHPLHTSNSKLPPLIHPRDLPLNAKLPKSRPINPSDCSPKPILKDSPLKLARDTSPKATTGPKLTPGRSRSRSRLAARLERSADDSEDNFEQTSSFKARERARRRQKSRSRSSRALSKDKYGPSSPNYSPFSGYHHLASATAVTFPASPTTLCQKFPRSPALVSNNLGLALSSYQASPNSTHKPRLLSNNPIKPTRRFSHGSVINHDLLNGTQLPSAQLLHRSSTDLATPRHHRSKSYGAALLESQLTPKLSGKLTAASVVEAVEAAGYDLAIYNQARSPCSVLHHSRIITVSRSHKNIRSVDELCNELVGNWPRETASTPTTSTLQPSSITEILRPIVTPSEC